VRSSCGYLVLAFGEDGLAWAEGLALQAGTPLPELGAAVLSTRSDRLVEARSPVRIAERPEVALLQLSADVRIAFTKAAEQLDEED